MSIKIETRQDIRELRSDQIDKMIKYELMRRGIKPCLRPTEPVRPVIIPGDFIKKTVSYVRGIALGNNKDAVELQRITNRMDVVGVSYDYVDGESMYYLLSKPEDSYEAYSKPDIATKEVFVSRKEYERYKDFFKEYNLEVNEYKMELTLFESYRSENNSLRVPFESMIEYVEKEDRLFSKAVSYLEECIVIADGDNSIADKFFSKFYDDNYLVDTYEGFNKNSIYIDTMNENLIVGLFSEKDNTDIVFKLPVFNKSESFLAETQIRLAVKNHAEGVELGDVVFDECDDPISPEDLDKCHEIAKNSQIQ